MKHFKKLGLRLALSISIIAAPLMGGVAQAAGNGTVDLGLSPVSGSYNAGDSVSVGVYEDSGSDTVIGVQANFTYSTSTLTYINTVNSSDFSISAQTTGGGGVVQLGRGTYPPALSGKHLVATMYFTATGSGPATINFDNGTAAVHGGDSSSATITEQNASFSVNSPSAPPGGNTGSGSGSTGSGSSGSSSSSSKSKTTTTAPASSKPVSTAAPQSVSTTTYGGQTLTVMNIAVTDLSAYGATINWQTSAPASSEVSYGQASDQLFFTASDNTLTVNHSLKLLKANLLAGQTYHFVVKSVDAQGNIATSQDMTFKTVTGAAVTTKNNNNTWIAAGVLAVLVLVILLGGHELRKMHRRAKELDSHFLTGDPLKGGSGPVGPTSNNSSSSVITPQDRNTPPQT